MAKAKFTLTNGTIVDIEGSTQEIQNLLNLYNSPISKDTKIDKISQNKKNDKESDDIKDHINTITNLIKDCDQYDNIEKNIIERSSQLNKALLPLYIIYEYLENKISLQTGDINKITKELGIPISQSHVSHTFSGVGSRYIMGDRVRKEGQAVKYKLNRRGLMYMKSIIQGKQNG